jgi:hypothetical protein
MNTPPRAEESLSGKLATSSVPQAETLGGILDDLLHCLHDLNSRLAVLEESQGVGAFSEGSGRNSPESTVFP